ncbi:XdhC family protein [Rhodococcus qingshengii]|uniref:XshC-Cox1 family protein n=1 Tax=Rhodococcus qingshengii TaxID=334542 RepID=A0A2A5IXJ8_RHOSG|nr:XdhC family protein [Rhodococcus qingshengii]PCK22055.1 XshC-Cox1 family protein [Rhodococcus qingshengii]
MREILDALTTWWESGESVSLATVVATSKSAPREPGAAMVVGPEGTVYGSVSGGCVEGAVYELAREVIEGGEPVLEHYGYSDTDAFAVGLTCGGELDVFVERIDRNTFPELAEVADDVSNGRPVAIATIIDHPNRRWRGRRRVLRSIDSGVTATGNFGSDRIDAAVTDDALGLLAAGHHGILTYGPDGERLGEGLRVFVQAFAPRPRLLVFGAIDFAAAVARMGSFLGYEVTVCDARPVFATRARFPEADEVVVDWPHRYLAAQHEEGRIDQRTVITVLTHDPKFDVPLLQVALNLPAAYIGAMGSRRTHEERLRRLIEVGVAPEKLIRLSSPIGLDLGGRTPEETAVSIAADIIAVRWGGSGEPLRATEGTIHHTAEESVS